MEENNLIFGIRSVMEALKAGKEIEHASKFGFPIHRPYHDLTKEEKILLWKGNEYFYTTCSYRENQSYNP